MARINWTTKVASTTFTTITQSLSFNVGRASYFDTWNGNTVTFTVRNNTGQAAAINQGDLITIGNDLSLISLYFYVVEVTFQDQISAAENTATITGVDAIGQILQFPTSGSVGASSNSLDQVAALMNLLAPFNPPYPDPAPVPGRATVETSYNDTTIGQRIVDLILTENSFFYYDGQTLVFQPSQAPSSLLWNFGPSTVAGSVIYDTLVRKYPNANYPNNVRVNSTTNGTKTAVVNGIYRRNYERDVLLTGSTQQQDLANYYANTLSDDDQLYLDIKMTDAANTSARCADVLNSISGMVGQRVSVSYTPPGGAATSGWFVIEGASVSAIPGITTFSFSLSPQKIYDLFTLNSSTFGILDTNRLGW